MKCPGKQTDEQALLHNVTQADILNFYPYVTEKAYYRPNRVLEIILLLGCLT
jgi:hypothetical protein